MTTSATRHDRAEAFAALLAEAHPRPDLPDAETRRELRTSLGLTQHRMAAAMGVSVNALARWEAGDEPSGRNRLLYAELLHSLRSMQEPS